MSDVYRTIEAVWKIESTRLIAAIARVTQNLREQELLTERLKQIEKAPRQLSCAVL